MKQGIVVCTWSGGKEAVEGFLRSIEASQYPVLVVVNGVGDSPIHIDIPEQLIDKTTIYYQAEDLYECGAIKVAMEKTDWDEFAFFQDTVEVKDMELFEAWFKTFAEQTVLYNAGFQMYLGKYRRIILERVNIPRTTTKWQAIVQESQFTRDYLEAETAGKHVWNPKFSDNYFENNWSERWGRKNLLMEDEHIRKFKGTWNSDHIEKI